MKRTLFLLAALAEPAALESPFRHAVMSREKHMPDCLVHAAKLSYLTNECDDMTACCVVCSLCRLLLVTLA